MEERFGFIRDWLTRNYSVTELCETYEISRKTGHKWIERFKQYGQGGLEELSRRPHGHPHTTPLVIQDKIVAFRKEHRYWGPKKLIDRLQKREPDITWPSASTAGSILKRRGEVMARRFRRRVPGYGQSLLKADQPNAVWGVDFKGWFRTQNGRRVDPLTISDLASRYLICCQAVKKTNGLEVREQFERVFREYGLPERIRSDNGPPFASIGLAGLSRLSVWWIRLGIKPERIRPGHPEENPEHERMHRTLKQETAHPPKNTSRSQQKAFDQFRREFNDDRPHEALSMQTPSERYQFSRRAYPDRLAEIEYPADYLVRRVRSAGDIKWKGELIYTSQALVGENLGLKQVDEKVWTVHFGPLCLATLDSKTKQLEKIKNVYEKL
jgi:transposase InsO family protein